MKYLIKRIQCVSGEVIDTHYVNIETNNIEATERNCTNAINAIGYYLVMNK